METIFTDQSCTWCKLVRWFRGDPKRSPGVKIRGRRVTWHGVLMALTHVAVLSLVLLVQTRFVFPIVIFSLQADYPGLMPSQVISLADELFPSEMFEAVLEPLRSASRCR